MIYRRGWVKVLYRHELENILVKNGIPNAKQVIDVLCGSPYENERHHFDYQVVDTEWRSKPDVTLIQRINQIWFVPLYLLTVPFQWLFRGKVGFSTTSKFASFIGKLTGLE